MWCAGGVGLVIGGDMRIVSTSILCEHFCGDVLSFSYDCTLTNMT